MRSWLARVWNDEEAFKRAARIGFRGLLAFTGYLLDMGIIPTGIDGGGGRFGLLGIVLGFFVPSSRIAPPKPAGDGHSPAAAVAS